MTHASLVLIALSIVLTSTAQVLLKVGMSSTRVQAALLEPGIVRQLFVIATSPAIILGLVVFGTSAVVWLFVLSRIDVSQAYPFVALGIVITAFAGHLLLGETLPALRIFGVAAIMIGVIAVARS
jgi:multidrug transporter EmrE-like cation transporter